MYVLSYKHINKLTDLPRHVRVCNDVMTPYRIQINVQCCCLTDFIFVGSYYKCIAMVVGFLGMALKWMCLQNTYKHLLMTNTYICTT